jgi:hypothetical protein
MCQKVRPVRRAVVKEDLDLRECAKRGLDSSGGGRGGLALSVE